MTGIGLIGDLHLSDKPPSNCTPEYNDQLFRMVEEIVHLSSQWDAAVFAGDIFHSKIPHRTSHRTVLRMMELINAFSCPVLLVPGNHDMQNDRLDSIHETQPFGALIRAGARLLHGWDDEFPLYGVPWQQDWDAFLRSDALIEWLTEGDDQFGDLKDCLLVTHAPIYPRGRENPWECIPASEFADVMQIGSCYYGHVHDHHGSYIEHTSGGNSQVHFCNQGSLSRGCLQEEDLGRIPAVTMWDPSAAGTPFFRVELSSAPPASEVFRLPEAAARVDYRARMDEFLLAVGSSTLSRTSVEAVLAHLQTLDLSDPERELAEAVLASAAAGELS